MNDPSAMTSMPPPSLTIRATAHDRPSAFVSALAEVRDGQQAEEDGEVVGAGQDAQLHGGEHEAALERGEDDGDERVDEHRLHDGAQRQGPDEVARSVQALETGRLHAAHAGGTVGYGRVEGYCRLR